MRGVAVRGDRDDAGRQDLRRARHRVPHRAAFAHARRVAARAPVHDARALPPVEAQGRRVGHEGEVLLRRLERRVDTSLGGREADEPGIELVRREGEEEVRVHGELGAGAREEVERGLAHRLARAAGRRDGDADAGGRKVYLRHDQPCRARRRDRQVRERHAEERPRGEGRLSRPGECQPPQGEREGEQAAQHHDAAIVDPVCQSAACLRDRPR